MKRAKKSGKPVKPVARPTVGQTLYMTPTVANMLKQAFPEVELKRVWITEYVVVG